MKTLDDDIREAFTALEGATPDEYFHGLSERINERLEVEAMGPQMTRETGKLNDAPIPGVTVDTDEEHSGLHDIKAMASSTKLRISRRSSTQSDAQDSLLASASSASLSAIVLPDPDKERSNFEPDGDAAKSAKHAGTSGSVRGAASAVADSSQADESHGTPVWLYGAAVAAVAAAVAIFFVMKSGNTAATTGTNGTTASDTVAAGDTSANRGNAKNDNAKNDNALARGSGASSNAPSATAQPIVAPEEENSASAAEPAASPAMESGDSSGDSPGENGSDKADGPVANNAGSSANAPRRAAAPPAKRTSRTRTKSSAARSGKTRKPGKTKKPTSSKPKKSSKRDDSKRSLDDLLDEAAGGAVSNKDIAKTAEPAKPKAPSKTDLSRSEIQAGMRKVLGRVSGCYDKFKVSGNVMIAVVVSPAGKVTSTRPKGKFKGTDTGKCVAGAAKSAKFPAWSGSPKRFSYPFLLSQ